MTVDILPSGAQNQLIQGLSPWQMPFNPGLGLNSTQSLSNLFALYNYWQGQQSLTISSATNLPTVQDGPIQVFKVGALTVNAALGFSNRCRGGILLCDSLTMGASGIITAPGGAAGSSKWLNQDILIPNNAVFTGKNTSWAQFQAWIAANGFFLFDPTLLALGYPGMGDIQANPTAWPGNGTAIISAAGCGAPGAAGANGAPGGGGVGNVVQGSGGYGTSGAAGAPGRVWGGGPGSGGAYQSTTSYLTPTDQYGGPGGPGAGGGTGGAGNPAGAGGGGGNGTGGVLFIICRGNVSLTSGHLLSANGASVSGGSGSGGGSGAGSISLFYLGTLTGTPNLTATGGGGGSPTGGAGSTQVKTFSAMGY
jgi:hypothetical protein